MIPEGELAGGVEVGAGEVVVVVAEEPPRLALCFLAVGAHEGADVELKAYASGL